MLPDFTMVFYTFSILHQSACDSHVQRQWDLLRKIFQEDTWKPQCFRYLSDRDEYGQTLLHLFCALSSHFDYSDEDKRDFINNRNAQNTLSGLELVQAISRNTPRINSTPLDVAYHLLHPDCIFLQDEDGQSPLHYLSLSRCRDTRLMHMVLEYAKTLIILYLDTVGFTETHVGLLS